MNSVRKTVSDISCFTGTGTRVALKETHMLDPKTLSYILVHLIVVATGYFEYVIANGNSNSKLATKRLRTPILLLYIIFHSHHKFSTSVRTRKTQTAFRR